MLGDLELLTMLLLQSPPDKDKRGQLPEVNYGTFGMSEIPFYLPLFHQSRG